MEHTSSKFLIKNDGELYHLFINHGKRKMLYKREKFFTPMSQYVYMVDRGIMKIYIENEEGDEKFLWLLGKGSMIPTYGPGIVTKRIALLTDTAVYMIEKDVLPKYFTNNPSLFDELMTQVYTRYDIVLQRFINNSTRTSRLRLLELLYEAAKISSDETKNISLKNYFSRQDMALYVGVHVTNVSKLLDDFESEGLLHRNNREIIIDDLELLHNALVSTK